MLRQLRRDRGQELVEYALVLPMLLLLLFGVVEMALMMFAYNTITDAAREGARYGVIHPTDTAGIQAAALRLTTGLNKSDLTVTPSLPGGNFIRVDVTYKARFITAMVSQAFGGKTYLLLESVATMQIE